MDRRRLLVSALVLCAWVGVSAGGEEDPQPLTVALLVERKTFEAGRERFGSFEARMRRSFEKLHALFDDVDATTTGGPLARQPVRDRFRIVHVDIYDRGDGTPPALFASHPDHDVVIVCDEGGPLAGFWLPAYSIGHNFLVEPDAEKGTPRRGLWSAWGEQALWHELLHFRGVPDAYIFFVPKAALPGRADADLELPERFRLGIMNHPYQEPRISALASVISNAKQGVARVGACEEPDHEHGHMWRWLPERLEFVAKKDGRPLSGAEVRWWRSQPMTGLGDPRRQGVPADAPPDGRATTDAKGTVVLRGDYLGRGDPRPKRSLWLLVEVEHGTETRWGIVLLLELNERYAAGERDESTIPLAWARLRPKRVG